MSLYELLNDGPDRQSGKIAGVMIAIVTSNEDPENLARVKLQYPWRGSSDESGWARIAVPSAGGKRGVYFVPEVGDEVLVAFENGDINHPYVIGSLWNGKEQPPEANGGGKNNVRVITSRAGHSVVFDDDSGGGSLTLRTNSGQTIRIDDTSGKESISLVDQSGNSEIRIDSAKSQISITSAAKLVIKSAEIQLEADASMTVKSGGMLTIQGAMVKIN